MNRTGTVALTWTFQADRLERLADAIMESVITVFGAAGVDLPDRQLITVGTPVHDCEEVVVVFQEVTKGLPGAEAEAQNCNVPSTATFQVHVVRCFPVSTGRGLVPPTATALTENADVIMQDCWLLMASADNLNNDPIYGMFGAVYSVEVGDPTGGYVASILNLQTVVP